MLDSSLVPVVFRALICPCLLLVGLSCKSPPGEEAPGTPAEGGTPDKVLVHDKGETPSFTAPTAVRPADAGSKEAAPAQATPAAATPAEASPAAVTPAATVPDAAPAESPAAVPAALEAGSKISARTKRTAAGLPEPLPGCVSWLRLKTNPAAPSEGSPHLAARQPYILLPERDKYSTGEKLSPPLPEGTTVALEEKKPEDDFIRKLTVMAREKEGWKFLEYSRGSSQEAFAPGDTAACSGCHVKAQASDSVYSLLVLE